MILRKKKKKRKKELRISHNDIPDNDIQLASERVLQGFGSPFLKATTSSYTLSSPSYVAMKFLLKLFFILDLYLNITSSRVESTQDQMLKAIKTTFNIL